MAESQVRSRSARVRDLYLHCLTRQRSMHLAIPPGVDCDEPGNHEVQRQHSPAAGVDEHGRVGDDACDDVDADEENDRKGEQPDHDSTLTTGPGANTTVPRCTTSAVIHERE